MQSHEQAVGLTTSSPIVSDEFGDSAEMSSETFDFCPLGTSAYGSLHDPVHSLLSGSPVELGHRRSLQFCSRHWKSIPGHTGRPSIYLELWLYQSRSTIDLRTVQSH